MISRNFEFFPAIQSFFQLEIPYMIKFRELHMILKAYTDFRSTISPKLYDKKSMLSGGKSKEFKSIPIDPKQTPVLDEIFSEIFQGELLHGFKLAYKRTLLRLDENKKMGGRAGRIEKIIAELKTEFVFSQKWLEICKNLEQHYPKRTIYSALSRMIEPKIIVKVKTSEINSP